MGVLEAFLALFGLVGLVVAAVVWWYSTPGPKPPREDAAAPYLEGLHAAMRMHTVGQALEQELYSESMRRAEQGQGDR